MNALNNRMRIGSQWLKDYAKLRHHRCAITEGIRVIAFRNMDHLNLSVGVCQSLRRSPPV